MKYSADDFRRVPMLHTAVLGSVCIFCERVVAYSPNPDMLDIAEKAHFCMIKPQAREDVKPAFRAAA